MTKKTGICLIWIGSAILIGFLLCFFTLSYRTRLLSERVNKTLAQSTGAGFSGSARIEAPIGFQGSSVSVLGGTWFDMVNSSDKAFVFTMIRNGIAAANVALVDKTGVVKAIIPLSDNARQLTEELPLPVYRFYAERIERDAQNRNLRKGTLR